MQSRGIDGAKAIGNKKEGKVPKSGHTLDEAMKLDTAGQLGAGGLGKHNFKEGNHNKGGGKICLRSDIPHPVKADKWRRT